MSERKSKTVFVRGLPSTTQNEKLLETFEQVGPVKTAFVVNEKGSKTCKGFGYVKFSMMEDAVKAKETVSHIDGKKIFVSFADAKKKPKAFGSGSKSAEPDAAVEKPKVKKPATPKQKPVKRNRIIIRNLSFKCKESNLREVFGKYGDISEVAIPLKNGTLSRGFAFIQFSGLHAAQRAVAEMNSKEILGRPVAVDWAVAKDRYLASNTPDKEDFASVEEEKHDSSSEEEDSSADESGDDDNDKEDDDSESSDEEKNYDSEDDDSEDEEENDDSDKEKAKNSDEEDDDDDDDSNGESEDSDDSESSEPKPEKSKPSVKRPSDVSEGRTLFVRNIPFDAEEEEVQEVFEQFGDVVYARLVVDKDSGQPKGTAFVQFADKDSADRCLAHQNEQNKIVKVNGRPVSVVVALSPSEIKDQKGTKQGKDGKDNRNLFLAREGLIRAGTQAAIGISDEDMNKRMKVELVKRDKLKNINIFVSSTRLCVHNLPPSVDEKNLKKVLLQCVNDSSAKITECRVMRDLNRKNQAGVSKSLGYAFVNFSTHEHALKALRELNNSSVFGDKKRPIVEFSLENKKVLEMKQRRLEKSKAQAGKTNDRRIQAKPEKSQQDIIAKQLHGDAPKGMPKRFGPKIRHRNRKGGAKHSKNRPTNRPAQNKASGKRKRQGAPVKKNFSAKKPRLS